jgi:hypothetical protein
VDLRETGWGHEDRIDMVQDRDQWHEHENIAKKLQDPSNVKNFLSS